MPAPDVRADLVHADSYGKGIADADAVGGDPPRMHLPDVAPKVEMPRCSSVRDGITRRPAARDGDRRDGERTGQDRGDEDDARRTTHGGITTLVDVSWAGRAAPPSTESMDRVLR
jgi:hypothetical protein